MVETVVDYGIFMLDRAGYVATWNSGAERLNGYRPDEIIGRHFSVFYTEEARAIHWPERELEVAAQEGRFEDEGWRVRKDGSRFWANVIITALRNSDGSLAGFGKVTRDLTQRRAYEEALRESEQRFRLLVESVRDYAIYMLSPEGKVESWNSGAALLLGFESAEVIGRPFSMFYRPEEQDEHVPESDLSSALREGRFEKEGWRVRRDGSTFWASNAIAPIYDATGQLRGYAKITRDMTDRRRLEELELSSKRMNEFLAMLAHELRNPLAPIRNAVTVLQLEPAPSPVVRSSRDLIDRQLSHLSRLVDDLLDVGRLTTGKITLKKERVLYNSVVARAAEAVRPLMDARQHRFRIHMPSEDIHVSGDAIRLVQVIQNLLINSAKYTPAGGHIELNVTLDGGQLRTSVKDNGIGLTAQTMEHIFKLFSQGDGEAAARESGLGIGLTLARSLVEMHGGVLKVESGGPGKGSTFWFAITAMPSQTSQEQGKGQGLRVLVVDDNRDAADSLAEILRLLGCSVKVAYDGQAALVLAREHSPQLALIDLGMPGMDGYELVGHLRAQEGGAAMLIGALTGYGNEEDRQRTREAGFDAHYTKPIDFATLQAFIERPAAHDAA